MPPGRLILLALLATLSMGFAVFWARAARRADDDRSARPGVALVAIGFVTDFLDTLGVGSFATTTSLFRVERSVDDRAIPGTMNVGHALPTVVQALVYITIIDVETTTLAVLLAAAVLGAWIGAGVVSRWSRRTVRLSVGLGLLVAAALLIARSLGLMPGGGDALGLGPGLLAVAAAINLWLGALMTAGIGLYAPCMIMVSLLGMNASAAFPIMMGSCAFLMLAASVRFVSRSAYDLRGALGLTLGGIPGVLVAAFVVRSLPLDAVRWLVVAVAGYTGVSLLRAVRGDA